MGQCYKVGLLYGWDAVKASHGKFNTWVVDGFFVPLSDQHRFYILIEVL